MSKLAFALAASLSVSGFALEASATTDYHNRTHSGHDKQHSKHYYNQNKRHDRTSQDLGTQLTIVGSQDFHRYMGQKCIEPTYLDNKDLQKLRVNYPMWEPCYAPN